MDICRSDRFMITLLGFSAWKDAWSRLIVVWSHPVCDLVLLLGKGVLGIFVQRIFERRRGEEET